MVDDVKTRMLEEGDHFGDYTDVRLLGEGGMGAVYLACASDGTHYTEKVMNQDAARKNTDFRTSSSSHVTSATPHAKLQKEAVRGGVTQESTTRKVSGQPAQSAVPRQNVPDDAVGAPVGSVSPVKVSPGGTVTPTWNRKIDERKN